MSVFDYVAGLQVCDLLQNTSRRLLLNKTWTWNNEKKSREKCLFRSSDRSQKNINSIVIYNNVYRTNAIVPVRAFKIQQIYFGLSCQWTVQKNNFDTPQWVVNDSFIFISIFTNYLQALNLFLIHYFFCFWYLFFTICNQSFKNHCLSRCKQFCQTRQYSYWTFYFSK